MSAAQGMRHIGPWGTSNKLWQPRICSCTGEIHRLYSFRKILRPGGQNTFSNVSSPLKLRVLLRVMTTQPATRNKFADSPRSAFAAARVTNCLVPTRHWAMVSRTHSQRKSDRCTMHCAVHSSYYIYYTLWIYSTQWLIYLLHTVNFICTMTSQFTIHNENTAAWRVQIL